MRIAILVSLGLVACGSDEPAPTRGAVNTASANASLESIHDLRTAIATENGFGAVGAVLGLTAAGQSIVVPSQPMRRVEVPEAWPRPTIAGLTGTVQCGGGTCTYTDYGDANYRLNGTISVSVDHVAFDLTFDITNATETFHWALAGDLTVTDRLIDGWVTCTGNAKGPNYSLSWDIDVGFNAIGLDADGCATSGSLDAEVAYTASGTSGSGSYHAAASIAFGPACGEVTVK